MAINVTIWNEFLHEQKNEKVRSIYADGIHKTIGKYLENEGEYIIRYATLEEPDHGLTEEVLANTDVLIWWGHMAHDRVKDEVVERVYLRVLLGMGLIVLHSSHYSKIFKKLMGTSCSLKWRCAAEKARVWVVEPTHPIAEGLGEYFEIEQEEMYGEQFDIPAPDTLVFISWFKGGEVFRSGCCYQRGYGKVFYFQPGHETYPVYHNKNVIKVINNAVRWCKPAIRRPVIEAPMCQPLEKLD
jgi:trehalose utilization protein